MNAHVARTDPPATTPSPWLPLWLALAALLATPAVGLLMRLVRAATDPGTGQGGGVSPGMLGVAATVLVAGAGVWVALRELPSRDPLVARLDRPGRLRPAAPLLPGLRRR